MAALAPDLPKVEQHIVEMTNQVRRAQNLTALRVNAMLAKAARAYAQKLAQSGQFSHSADGRNPQQRAESAGYKPCSVAENIAMDRDSRGFATGELAMQAVAGWMNSPPHRANLLTKSATEIGVGVAQAPGAAPKFISVQMLGRPASEGVKFEVFNGTSVNVTYSFEGRTHDLKPRSTITQTSCGAGEIKLAKPAASAPADSVRIKAQNGKRYSLRNGGNGSFAVEISVPAKKP